MKNQRSEKGAAAVEFALVVPLLFLILFGIIDFGRAYNAQISLTQAARAAVRSLVVSNDTAKADTAAFANTVGLSGVVPVYSPAGCPNPATVPATTVTATVTYTLDAIGGFLPLTLTGTASMQCGG
ncbi:TadE/TadG family type IV pilus assembly protein [Arthrobacter sp. STN4]|uniref:TadE/TadG family type IV pilus assembly protein n=1 Tax=Arthrobacter sp. STN4 TaxID=2923276 RepID=UPI002119E1F8|nr:TadE/TadG family type IV pilus assembly protein [Arthrobacter sp. STN4]MCQ9163599.1 pilus assembly protein [Arthrobacter sp. STN4]